MVQTAKQGGLVSEFTACHCKQRHQRAFQKTKQNWPRSRLMNANENTPLMKCTRIMLDKGTTTTLNKMAVRSCRLWCSVSCTLDYVRCWFFVCDVCDFIFVLPSTLVGRQSTRLAGYAYVHHLQVPQHRATYRQQLHKLLSYCGYLLTVTYHISYISAERENFLVKTFPRSTD